MPQQMSVSLRTMLKITDCVQHKVAASNGDLLNTPQYYMDECLSLFPHMYVGQQMRLFLIEDNL